MNTGNSGPHVLVIDADTASAELFAKALRDEGYMVTRASDGDEGLRAYEAFRPDLVLLDVTLPRRSGLELLRELRRNDDVPVIICSARDADADRVVGLELGADDYAGKALGSRELVARVGAVLRRARCRCGAIKRAVVPAQDAQELEIDRAAHEARHFGRPIPLTPTEFRILETLERHAGQILTRAQLLNAISVNADIYDRTLDKHIANLRKKLEADPAHPRYVVTVFGVGYTFSRGFLSEA